MQLLKSIYYFWHALKRQSYFNPFAYLRGLSWYFGDLVKFFFYKKNDKAKISFIKLYPMIGDKHSGHSFDAVYFFQDSWAAKHIFSYKPKKHVDIGSSVKTMGIISQFVPTTFVDIRKLTIKLNGLTFLEGSILNLPFKDNSLESVSSLCVIEHIGLGRYGDQIDSFGTEKAVAELERVVKKKGNLLISVPIDSENSVFFNSHRAFTPNYFKSLFKKSEIVDEQYLYGEKVFNSYDKSKGYGIGFYRFTKK